MIPLEYCSITLALALPLLEISDKEDSEKNLSIISLAVSFCIS